MNSNASTVDVPATNADDLDASDAAVDEPHTEVTRLKNATDNKDIDLNVRCMCLLSWHNDVLEGDGAEWAFCKCGRWMHKDYIEDVVADSDGFQCFSSL